MSSERMRQVDDETRRVRQQAKESERIRKIEAENARLRKAIEEAPHDVSCRTVHPFKTIDGKPMCDCWKRNALES